MGNIISTVGQFIRELVTRYLSYFKTSNIVGKILLGLVPLIAACCICFGSIVVFGSDAKPTAEEETELESTPIEVAEEPTSTEEAIELAAVEPSATLTLMAPTATDLPTNTPEPTEISEPTSTPTPPYPPGEEAVVTDIIDGDTIEVEIDGTIYAVRYIGMDTPERGEPFADESTTENTRLVAGKKVILVSDVSETDRFGRLLRYVYLEDGTMVNAELIRLGYAQAIAYPPDTANNELFMSLQEQAEDSSLGLWSTTAFFDPTSTPVPQPTNSPVPVPSNTPLPLPTDTVVPLPTSTVATLPTDTPIPQPTQPPVQTVDVQITYIYFDGQVARVESDEYAEITNRGNGSVNLAGWRLNAGDPGQDFWFPAFDLQPGQSCRVYTNEHHPESCGFSFGKGQAIWNNSDHDCGYLYDASGAQVSVNCY